MMTKSQDWHPEDIKAAIRKRGMTTSQLSRCHGLSGPEKYGRLPFPSYRPGDWRMGW